MPLEKVLLPVDFTGGLDTKTDEKLVVPGKLLALENAHWKGRTLAKREGGVNLPVVGQGTMSDPRALAVLDDELLRVGTDGIVHGYLEGQTTWGRRGTHAVFFPLPAWASRDAVTRDLYSQRDFDSAPCDGGRSGYVWRELRNSTYVIRACVIDEATGAVIVAPDTIASASVPISARILGMGTKLCILYTVGSNLIARLWDPSAGTTGFGAATTLKTDVYVPTAPDYVALDAVRATSTIGVVAYPSTASSNTALNAFLLNTSGTLPAIHLPGSQMSIAITGGPADVHVGYLNASTIAFVFQSRTAADVYVFTTSFIFAPQGPTTSLGVCNVFQTQGKHRVAMGTNDGVTMWLAFDSNTTGGIYRTSFVAAVTGVAALSQYLENHVLASDLFFLQGKPYAVHVWNSQLQPTAFVSPCDRSDASRAPPCARLLAGTSQSNFNLVTRTARPYLLPDGSWSILLGERGRLAFQAGGFDGKTSGTKDATAIGLVRYRLTVGKPEDTSRVPFAGGLFLAGARAMLYDGKKCYEAGFDEEPFINSANQSTGGSLSVGTYQWCVVAERLDARGRRTLGPPSGKVSITTAVAGQKVDFTVAAYPFQQDAGSLEANVAFHLYRTEANGTILYRVSSVDAPPIAPPSGTVALSDGVSDSSARSGELLYTQGGVLDCQPPPAHRFAHAHRRRLFLGGCEDPFQVFYSFEELAGETPAFNPLFAFRVPEDKGVVTGFGSVDDKLAIFCERGIYIILGDGPDPTGAQNTFTLPEPLAFDVGCLSWKSICQTRDGVLFQSSRGFHVLTRGLDVAYVGEAVEAYNALSCVRAVTLETTRQIRLSMTDPLGVVPDFALVFDYENGQWSVFPGYPGGDAAVWSGSYCRAFASTVRREVPGNFSDAGAAYGWKLRTSWLKLSALQGFQRIYRALLLGKLSSAASVTIRIYADYDGTAPVETVTRSLATSDFAGAVLQVEHHLARQKCEAVAFEVECTAAGQGFSLTNLTLQAGMKRGAKKLPAAKRL